MENVSRADPGQCEIFLEKVPGKPISVNSISHTCGTALWFFIEKTGNITQKRKIGDDLSRLEIFIYRPVDKPLIKRREFPTPRTMAKYFCIKKFDLTKYFLRIDYRTNELSRAALIFTHIKTRRYRCSLKKWWNLRMYVKMRKTRYKSRYKTTSATRPRKGSASRCWRFHIGDHKREATHGIVFRHWLAWWSWQTLIFSLSPRRRETIARMPGPQYPRFNSRNSILDIRNKIIKMNELSEYADN